MSEEKAIETKTPGAVDSAPGSKLKISETAKELFDSDRGEAEMYQKAADDAEVPLPLTRAGFEALLVRASNVFKPAIPLEDNVRSAFAGYVHHIEKTVDTVKLSVIAKLMFKQWSNALTWTIDQEIKQKRQDEIKKLTYEAEKEAIAEKKAKAEEKRQRKAARKYSVKGTEETPPATDENKEQTS
jgi:hypothetical protein